MRISIFYVLFFSTISVFIARAESVTVEFEATIIEQSELADIIELNEEFGLTCHGSRGISTIGDNISGSYTYDSETGIIDGTENQFVLSESVTGNFEEVCVENGYFLICGPFRGDQNISSGFVYINKQVKSYEVYAGAIAAFSSTMIHLQDYLAGNPDLNTLLNLHDWGSGLLHTQVCHTDVIGRGVTAELTKLETKTDARNVHIDVRPKRCPNKIRIPVNNTRRKLHVAVLGQADFNINDVELNSVRLEGVQPIKHRIRDITTPHFPVNPEDPADCGTVSRDGYDDVRFVFPRDEIAAAIERKLGRPAEKGEVINVKLIGKLKDGSYFSGEDYLMLRVKRK